MDSTQRFSSRVDTYVKYRPSYPKEAVNYLFDVVGLRPGEEAADIGAGTGIFSKLLLERGVKVTAVEPNDKMREAAKKELGDNKGFRIVAGSAEATGLPDQSVNMIVCAQSFHWFDRQAARTEFQRIVRPGGRTALIWNSRLTEGTPFREQYDQLLYRYGTDYAQVVHTNITPEMLASFFEEETLHEARFINSQLFDFDGLRGRLLSSSYCPLPGHPNYEPMLAELLSLFERNQVNGKISFDYVTQVFWGE
jgi:ubiquinone/menaquinone biosynthesis C-methylase UbiE